ncbi:hypothetical protein GCM10010339_34500 [Streptomyces alanosinicus]|uniref:Uncharacterized protein n=1 Tax=Streptomyces alanosinicus TaxID=68171 RepID=A0A919D385_9ACTN|nr:hypothetical protein GCM10010339_34500 [Streptomyces alanosinicus]
MGIIHALLRWALGMVAPGTGRRRAVARLTTPAPVDWPEAPCLPAHRSPYGHDVPLDGHAAALVRPYVVAMDFGIDLDRYLIGAEGLAR